ncbi:hypothetical protein NQ315_000319 [Exocentrus adspersus]|uniref:Regulator of microtubule dynamics protein 1 n=1 Tax=Exocentrus adspersus TaxID=1586481 RepID=A0AAV8VR11_9CUCU|nr:hypothetical protein NQ315_000319 [Exocentrus adspersus]
MPLPNNFHAFLGAAMLGVISAAGLYLVEHYRQEKTRHAMARDLARLDHELSVVKRELEQLTVKKKEKSHKSRKSRASSKANSVLSASTDDYTSASNIDSSDLEFYDLSDNENAVDGNSFNLAVALSELDRKLDAGTLTELGNALQKLQELCLEHPENSELLWRVGKAHQKISDKSDDGDFIKEHVSKGIEACSMALRLDPGSAEAHKWYAILIGSRSDFVSLQEKISDGHLFKKHVDEALALSPRDPSLHHMLGRFDFEVAGLKWYERKVAAALFSEPPNATYAEALGHFMEAERLANFEWKENKLMIGKCKIATGDYKEAVEWLDKASNCKQGDGLDDKVDSEVKVLLEKYNSYR